MSALVDAFTRIPALAAAYIALMLAVAAVAAAALGWWWLALARWRRNGFGEPPRAVRRFAAEIAAWMDSSAEITGPVEAMHLAADQRLDRCRAAANLLVLMGLLGTVYGLIVVAGGLPDAVRLQDAAATETALGDALSGLQIAFFTTLAGVLGSIALRGLLLGFDVWFPAVAMAYASSEEAARRPAGALRSAAAALQASATALFTLVGIPAGSVSPLLATAERFDRAVGLLRSRLRRWDQRHARDEAQWTARHADRDRQLDEAIARFQREWQSAAADLSGALRESLDAQQAQSEVLRRVGEEMSRTFSGIQGTDFGGRLSAALDGLAKAGADMSRLLEAMTADHSQSGADRQSLQAAAAAITSTLEQLQRHSRESGVVLADVRDAIAAADEMLNMLGDRLSLLDDGGDSDGVVGNVAVLPPAVTERPRADPRR